MPAEGLVWPRVPAMVPTTGAKILEARVALPVLATTTKD